MRVIAGTAKGITIKCPKGRTVRPTSDKIKGAVFNSLQSYPHLTSFLDLFSGSGSIAIEAASRGFHPVTLVESDNKSLAVIKKNIMMTKMTDNIIIIKGSFKTAIEKIYIEGKTFDIIFADPPYNKGYPEELFKMLNRFPIINPKGLVIIEEMIGNLAEQYLNFATVKKKKYGNTEIRFYQLEVTI